MAAKNPAASTEIVNNDPDLLTKTELATFDASPEGIKAYLESIGLSTDDVNYAGDGYPLIDKKGLENVPLFLIQWEFGTSKSFGTDYVSARGVRLDNGEKFSLFDSGTGVRDQLVAETDRRIALGLAATQQGLRVKGITISSYPADAETGRPAGETAYLQN